MAKEWTDDEIQAQITECVNIVREDRERQNYESLHERFGKKDPTEKPPGEGDPPPPKETSETDPPAGKKSLWWGDRT